MWEDPIVADVHRTREKIAAAYNFDVKAYFADLRKRQAALGARLVCPRKQPNQALHPSGAGIPVCQDSMRTRRPPASELLR